MNFSNVDKVVDDLEPELDSLYRIIGGLYMYITVDDIIATRQLSRRRYNRIHEQKMKVLNDLCESVRDYNTCRKRHVENESYTENRTAMKTKIGDVYLKLINERIEAESDS